MHPYASSSRPGRLGLESSRLVDRLHVSRDRNYGGPGSADFDNFRDSILYLRVSVADDPVENAARHLHNFLSGRSTTEDPTHSLSFVARDADTYT